MIEWEGENESYTPVPLKFIVGGDTTCKLDEGSHVKVKEGRTNKLYNGVIIKRGMLYLYSRQYHNIHAL